jgi:hypothetical protein
MNDVSTYYLRLRGPIDEDEINAMSPLQLTPEPTEPTGARLAVRTDQSGLIGLLRHLHARGLVILAVQRDD